MVFEPLPELRDFQIRQKILSGREEQDASHRTLQAKIKYQPGAGVLHLNTSSTLEDVFAAVTAVHDVVDGAFVLDTKFAGHGCRLVSKPRVSILGTDPF